MYQSKLIETIKERRETLSVTQEMLAELSGVGLRTLKHFESGKGNPTIKTLQKLTQKIWDELLSGEDKVTALTEASFLNEKTKRNYLQSYRTRYKILSR